MKKYLCKLMAVMMVLLSCEWLSAETTKEALFSTPQIISAKISPNGKFIASVGADAKGVPNLFVNAKQITFFDNPDIIQFFWSPDSNKVLLLKDFMGKGQHHLHGIDIHSMKSRVYTEEFKGINTKVIQISNRENKAVIGLNHRNSHFHDLYVLDLDTGNFSLLFENNHFAKFLLSPDLEMILKMKINGNGSWTVLTSQDEVFMQLSAEEAFQTEFLSYDQKKNGVYLLDNRFSDTNQLILKSLSKGYPEEILGIPTNSDVNEVFFTNGEPKAFASYYTKKKWHIIDPAVSEDFNFLESELGSNFEILSQSEEGNTWVVVNNVPHKGIDVWVYDRPLSTLSVVHTSQRHSDNYAKTYEMIAEARDGEKLVCYYTLPKDQDRGGYVDAPIPLVVIPHGGPFKVRNYYEFDPFHQWLASCGYAVLNVNFRLSSGFGKAWVNAGNGQWGGKAHFDVIDAVEACIEKGITQSGKLAIFGISYGGYESLASLTFSPDYFTCCVAICGPSNLKTVLDNVPQFWEFTAKPLSDHTMFFTKKAFITSMGGDPDEVDGANYLEKCSPLNYLDRISAPLLLVHGQNDHVVVENESRQIYESMKANQKKVTYILFPDEGHRLAKFPNKLVYLDAAERFFSEHLGGKYSPIDPNIRLESSAIFYD